MARKAKPDDLKAIDAIQKGITPRALEEAISNRKFSTFHVGTGLGDDTVRWLAERWGLKTYGKVNPQVIL